MCILENTARGEPITEHFCSVSAHSATNVNERGFLCDSLSFFIISSLFFEFAGSIKISPLLWSFCQSAFAPSTIPWDLEFSMCTDVYGTTKKFIQILFGLNM